MTSWMISSAVSTVTAMVKSHPKINISSDSYPMTSDGQQQRFFLSPAYSLLQTMRWSSEFISDLSSMTSAVLVFHDTYTMVTESC
jgi:hypothetical protein